MSAAPAPFWRTKTLAEMTDREWESLCDGCGKCCLHKVRTKRGAVKITNVACRLLDLHQCRCTNYPKRKALVPDCVVLTPESVPTLDWLPTTCAYKLVSAGEDLPTWHPLRSGNDESVHGAGISVRGRAINEREAGPLTSHIVEWKGF
ncbi:MAG: YcgN family cysteine cluster protein [Rhodospirillaceae bacterium]|nr:YcgN family cysteine cluster protein [Rhodospirillaceae bacterium]